jgi:hypothetical protein
MYRKLDMSIMNKVVEYRVFAERERGQEPIKPERKVSCVGRAIFRPSKSGFVNSKNGATQNASVGLRQCGKSVL